MRRHDVRVDELPAGHFDLVHTRLVLEHLPERDDILGRLVGTLRPAGWLVVEDVDLHGVDLIGPDAYRRAMETPVAAMHAIGGADLGWARHLAARFGALGLVDVRSPADSLGRLATRHKQTYCASLSRWERPVDAQNDRRPPGTARRCGAGGPGERRAVATAPVIVEHRRRNVGQTPPLSTAGRYRRAPVQPRRER